MRLMPTSSDPSNEIQQQMQQMMKIMPLMFESLCLHFHQDWFYTFHSTLCLQDCSNILFEPSFQNYIRRSNRITLNTFIDFKEEKINRKNKYRSTKYQ